MLASCRQHAPLEETVGYRAHLETQLPLKLHTVGLANRAFLEQGGNGRVNLYFQTRLSNYPD